MKIRREGHLDALIHVFDFLIHNYTLRIEFYPIYHDININVFKECYWKDFYDSFVEAIPINAPEFIVRWVDLILYADNDNNVEKTIQRSWSVFFIYMKTNFIRWFKKVNLP